MVSKFSIVCLCIVLFISLIVSSCAAEKNKKSDTEASSTMSNQESMEQSEDGKTVSEDGKTVTEDEKTVSEDGKTVSDTKNATGKVIIRAISTAKMYYNNSYSIISKAGTEVVADPYRPVDGLSPDIITLTHSHYDHVDYNFLQTSDCRKSYSKAESFNVKDISVTGISASHNVYKIADENPSNVIYLFEIDGLRIAHMGDIGQEELTDSQLGILGKVDIAFMQFVNGLSDYSLENEKGIKLIEQLKPQIIIPTHSSEEATKKIGDIVGSYESVENELIINKDDLKDGKRRVISIINTLSQNQ